MKNLLVLLLISITISVNAQSWNNTVTLFGAPVDSKISSCENQNGVYLIYYTNNSILFSRITSSGIVQLSNITKDTGSDISSAKINSIGTDIFVTYYKSNKIRIAKSTDSGSNWTVNYSTFNVQNTGFNALDTYVEGWNFHIAWSEKRIGDPYTFDTHYVKFQSDNLDWVGFKTVTDIETDGGDKPSIVVSNSRVHVTYSQYFEIHNRDKIISNGQWQSVENVPYNLEAPVTYVPTMKTFFDGNYLHVVYRYVHSGWKSTEHVGQAYRPISGGTWVEDNNTFFTDSSVMDLVSIQTSDKKVHLFYNDVTDGVNYHKTISGTTWNTIETFDYYPNSFNAFADISSAGNDIFRFEYLWVNHTILYQQYDAAPETPQNFAAAFTGTNPVISWTILNSPDIQNYKIDKRIIGETGWATVATVSSSSSSWIDVTVTHPHTRFDPNYTIEYRMRAVDNGGKYSNYTNTTSVNGNTNYLWKISSGGDNANITTYKLFTNYPNPFNPSTKIEFQIPQDGFVNLTVYNSLGQKVKELVNSNLSVGKYSVNFNTESASVGLPSGLYIYKLSTSGILQNYTEVKKMLLLK